MTFQGPCWLALATAAGALLLWSSEGPEKLRIYALSAIVDRISISENMKYAVQLVIFLGLGTFIALILTEPANVRQAFASGLGWTALARRGKT